MVFDLFKSGPHFHFLHKKVPFSHQQVLIKTHSHKEDNSRQNSLVLATSLKYRNALIKKKTKRSKSINEIKKKKNINIYSNNKTNTNNCLKEKYTLLARNVIKSRLHGIIRICRIQYIKLMELLVSQQAV